MICTRAGGNGDGRDACGGGGGGHVRNVEGLCRSFFARFYCLLSFYRALFYLKNKPLFI